MIASRLLVRQRYLITTTTTTTRTTTTKCRPTKIVLDHNLAVPSVRSPYTPWKKYQTTRITQNNNTRSSRSSSSSNSHQPAKKSTAISSHHPTPLPPPKSSQPSPPSSTSSSSSSSSTTLSKDSNFINAPYGRGRNDDSLSRFPNLYTPGGILRGLDYAGTITFAVTGSVTAAQSGLDVFGCSMVAMITAVGGGTIRDSILLSKRPFWTNETEYIWMTVVTGCITFFLWPFVLEWQQQDEKEDRRDRQQEEQQQEIEIEIPLEPTTNNNDTPTTMMMSSLSKMTTTTTTTTRTNNKKNKNSNELYIILDTLDAIGLSAFAIIGAQNGIRAGMSMVVSSICGMTTSTFGGMLRDVLCARPIRIVHSNAEIYALPALLGAITYLVTRKVPTSTPAIRIGSAFFVCMGCRYVAIIHNVKLHTWDTQQDGLGVTVRK